MNDAFVPLFAAEHAPGRASAAPFQPTPAARPAPGPPSLPDGAPAGRHHPVVSLVREGERVTHIRVTCSCGQVIELACDYA